MIDPINMTRYGLTTAQLEETLLFACCVAGKNAVTTAKALDRFLRWCEKFVTSSVGPFDLLRQTYDLMQPQEVALILRKCGIGCFNNRARTFKDLIDRDLNLKTCTPADLEQVWGIAEKTSRFFILHTRPDVRLAALDTHIKKFMVSKGISFPKGQPKGKRYLELEQKFLKLADKSGMTVAEFDLMLWRRYAGHSEKKAA